MDAATLDAQDAASPTAEATSERGWPRVGVVVPPGVGRGDLAQARLLVRFLHEAGGEPVLLEIVGGEPPPEVGLADGRELRSEAIRPAPSFEQVFSVRRAANRHGVEVLHALGPEVNKIVAGAARTMGIPSVGALRGDAARAAARRGSLGNAAFRWPSLLVGDARAQLLDAVRLGVPTDRLAYLPRAVDVDAFTPMAPPDRPSFTVGFVGGLTAAHRVADFALAITMLRDRLGERVRAVVVGDGPESAALASAPPWVVWHRDVPDLRSVFGSINALYVPSAVEDMPTRLLEAMLVGVPVVATAVGGIPEVVHHGRTGLLVPVGDVHAAVWELETLARDPRQAQPLVRAARDAVIAGHGPDPWRRHLRDLYQRALASR